MDGSGSPALSGSRLLAEDDGSTGEKERKNREERLKLIKQQQELQQEKRLAELKAAYEKESRARQLKDAERAKKLQEIKMREFHRRQAVEERRRRLETEEQEKREQILAKYKEYEHRLTSQKDQKKPVYAFGSSTPRTLTYLEHLDNPLRVYNSRLAATAAAGGADDDSTKVGAASSPEKRAISACSLTRKPLTARRWGGSMVASMYGGSPALSTSPQSRADPLSNVNSMTTSFAVGETSGISTTKNVRTKGPLSPSASSRSQSTSRLARTTTATARKSRQQESNTDHQKSTAVRRNDVVNGINGVSTSSGNHHAVKVVSSVRTPSAPPTNRRSIVEATPKLAAASTPKSPSSAFKEKPPKPSPPKVQSTGKESPDVPKIIRKPKTSSGTTTPNLVSPMVEIKEMDGFVAQEIPKVTAAIQELIKMDDDINMNTMHLQNDHMDESFQTPPSKSEQLEEFLPPSVEAVNGSQADPMPIPIQPLVDDQNLLTTEFGSKFEMMDMTASANDFNVPKPTGQGGKVLSKEEATAALAERRRLAREQMEREKELERQREEQRRLEEEEMLRREEEEFRRQEAEELRILEEAKQEEQMRIRKMVEEEEKRREEEAKQKEEEQQKKFEAEAKAREEAEKADRERKEADEKFKKEEAERLERKKKLDAIMQRTRQSGATPSSTSSSKQTQPGQSLTNGNNEHAGDSLYSTPNGSNTSYIQATSTTPSSHAASSSILKKIAKDRPEMGRSLENILNRVRSTPNVNEDAEENTTGSTQSPSIMTTSFSADKVSHSPTNGDSRMTQSFYATPGDRSDQSFNNSGLGSEASYGRTEYDIDAPATKSQSRDAMKLQNQAAQESAATFDF